MTGSLNFNALSSAAALRPSAAVQRTAAPPQAPPTETAKPTARPEPVKPGGGVHLAAEEMAAHVAEALEKTTAFEGEQAPLIDPAHLDEDPEAELNGPTESEAPEAFEKTEELEEAEAEGEAEALESKEIEPAEAEEAEAESEAGDREGQDSESEADPEAAEGERLESYLISELERYLREQSQPALRLLTLAGPVERSRKAHVAVALEARLGGLAPVLPGMPGDFIVLTGPSRGQIVDHIGVAPQQAFQANAFKQALLQHLQAPGIDRVLLDLEYVPPLQRPLLLALLKSPQAHPCWIYLNAKQIQGLS